MSGKARYISRQAGDVRVRPIRLRFAAAAFFHACRPALRQHSRDHRCREAARKSAFNEPIRAAERRLWRRILLAATRPTSVSCSVTIDHNIFEVTL